MLGFELVKSNVTEEGAADADTVVLLMVPAATVVIYFLATVTAIAWSADASAFMLAVHSGGNWRWHHISA